METPKLLYHYTTINTLALILKSRSINFSRADKVNDKREGSTSDFGSFAQYLFLSCWTETSEENLALWNIYTPNMRGVRIELPNPIFDIYKLDDIYDSIIPETEIFNKEKGYLILPHKGILYEVTYTDNEELLSPKILATIEGYHGFSLSSIGIHKKTMWAFENEWRFRLNIIPLDKTKNTNFSPDLFNDLMDNKVPPPFLNYLIKIREESFTNMKIRLGPKVEPGDVEIVNSLINTFNSKANLETSSLEHEIR